MKIDEARIGLKVNHSKYGVGTIIAIDRNITVDFEAEYEEKHIRIMKADYIEIIKEKKEVSINSSNNDNIEDFKKGDQVTHLEYGEGIIIEKRGFFKSVVKFNSQTSYIVVLNDKLKKIESSIINDDEIIEVDLKSQFQVVPTNYSEQNCYSKNAKKILTYFRKMYSKEGLASIKSYKEKDGETGVLIIPSQGVIVFKIFDNNISEEIMLSPLFDSLVSSQYESFRNHYYNLFLQSRNLCIFKEENYKILKFPIRFVFLYQNIDLLKIKKDTKEKIILRNKNIFFKNFMSLIDNNELFSNFETHSKNFNRIDEKMYGSIVERVIPENATLINIEPKSKKNIVEKKTELRFEAITGNEREFSALCLDDSQIKTINDTKPGHYLTLANPGTGKSVLLISKAYRLQSMNKESHVLITCYNKNLAEHHTIFSEVSGMKNSHLHIGTFHKYIRDILTYVDPNYIQSFNYEDEDSFNQIVDRFEFLLDIGLIKTKLNGIFIDEIQLFEPKWIDICYRLLDKDSNNFYFEMYGDINQDVKSQRSKGKASWQNTKLIPSLQGRVRKLDKNYRNTDLISNYLKSLIADFNLYLIRHNIPVDNESSCLSSDTIRKGGLRTKILLSPNSEFGKVTKTIQELVTKAKADYNDIAIVYPAKKYGKYYTPVYKIKKDLNDKDIPYCFIHGDDIGDEKRHALYDCDGVIMTTIDSCLGLDFKYVILVGIHYWDFIYDEKTNSTRKLNSKELIKNQQAKFYINEIGKKIYSACSRAREGLYIIDDLDDESPIKSIIRPKSGRSYYDEH